MNIKTKLTYGIGLLFVLITLLGGLAIKNIHNGIDRLAYLPNRFIIHVIQCLFTVRT